MPTTRVGRFFKERKLKKIAEEAAAPLELEGPTPSGDPLLGTLPREDIIKKQAGLLREEGFSKEAIQLELDEEKLEKAMYEADTAQLDFNIAQGYQNMDGMRAGLQMIQAGAVEEGQAYMNRFLPPEQQVQQVQPLPNGNFMIQGSGEGPAEEVAVDNLITSLVDAKTQFLADQQMQRLRLEQKESARSRGAEDTPNKILARIINKKMLGEQMAEREGIDREDDLYNAYPELRLLPTEQELLEKHEWGNLIAAAMGTLKDNPEMWQAFGSSDPSEIIVNIMMGTRSKLKEAAATRLRKGKSGAPEVLPEGLSEKRLEAVIAREKAAGRRADRDYIIEQFSKRRTK